MKKPVLLFLAMLAWLGSRAAAHAEHHLVDGAQGCFAIGGEWQPGDYQGGTCRVPRLVIDADDTLTVVAGVNLTIDGNGRNYGSVETQGRFRPNGTFYNRGTLTTEGITVPGYLIVNTGIFVNRGWLHTHGQIDNYGIFENEGRGFIETCSGAIINYAYMHNASDSYIDNWFVLIRNEGFLVNDGHMYNPSGDSYRIENFGAFENAGDIYNGGVIWNACGGAFYGGGSISGNPPEYQDCDPEYLLYDLISRVLKAGSPPTPTLCKSDVRSLTDYLARAAKDVARWYSAPEIYSSAPAEAKVQAFMAEVRALTAAGTLPEYLGAALVGWAERILVVI
ncbi:MAG: hypothetical protein FJW35_17765, partial [Acidobacteria bacterium]|nr:hypothetical protein [Acidobacteriota bacterium]